MEKQELFKSTAIIFTAAERGDALCRLRKEIARIAAAAKSAHAAKTARCGAKVCIAGLIAAVPRIVEACDKPPAWTDSGRLRPAVETKTEDTLERLRSNETAKTTCTPLPARSNPPL